MQFTKKIRLFACVVLFGYLLGVFAFLGPYIEYVVNYQYIVTQLCVERDVKDSCCKGKCHLNEELKEEQQKNTRQDVPYPASRFEMSVHVGSLPLADAVLQQSLFSWAELSVALSTYAVMPVTPPPEVPSVI